MKLSTVIKRKKQSSYFAYRVSKVNDLNNLPDNFISKAGYTKKDLLERLDKQKKCSSSLIINYDINDKKTLDDAHVSQSNYCNCKSTCNLCNSKVQWQKRRKYNDKIFSMVDSFTYLYFVTFTIKAGERLEERLNHLRDSLKAFRKKGQKGRSGEFRKVGASVICLETKRGENSKGWHVHAHCLFFTNEKLNYTVYNKNLMSERIKKLYEKRLLTKKELLPYCNHRHIDDKGNVIPLSKFSKEWFDCTGDSFNVSIEPINFKKSKEDYISYNKRLKIWEPLQRRIAETIKYFTKTENGLEYDYLEIIDSLYNRRTLSTTGKLYKIKEPEKPEIKRPHKNFIFMTYKSQNRNFDYHPKKANNFNPDLIKAPGAKPFLHEIGKMLGGYRNTRRELLKNRIDPNLHIKLDNLRKGFSDKVKQVWKQIAICTQTQFIREEFST